MISRFFKFEIPKMGPCCVHCRMKWDDGAVCHSSIYEGPEGHWIRQDVCHLCQEYLLRNSEERFFWQARVAAKPKKEMPSFEPINKAIELLRCSLTDNRVSAGEAFVLALFLKRKKKLIEKKEIVSPSGEICVLYEDPCSDEAFAIPKLNLDSLEVEKIQQELKLKFSA